MRFLRTLFGSLAFACAATAIVTTQAVRPAFADLTVVQTRTISGLENVDPDLYGVPVKCKFYYKGDFYREELSGRVIRIYDAKNDRLFILDPNEEIYTVTSMKDAEQRSSFQALPGTEMRYEMNMDAGGTSDKVAKFPAKNYILAANGVLLDQASGAKVISVKVDGEIWLTEKLKLPSKNPRLLKMALAIFPLSFRMVSPDFYKKMQEANGVPLSFNATLNLKIDAMQNSPSMNVEIQATADSVSTKTLSASLFKVPGNYRKATPAEQQKLLSK